MKQFGLLGGSLSHSYSPRIHQLLGSYQYDLFPVSPEELESFLLNTPFDGLNVTIPYKKAVIPYCSALSSRAAAIGSVNTLLRQPDGTLLGENTDYYGFSELIQKSGVSVKGRKLLILGDGGAAATVRAVLHDLGAGEIVTISRRGPEHYGVLSRHYDADGIINTTPVGMFPENGHAPLSLNPFPRLCAVWDLIYNPARTRLMLDAQALGIPAFGGLEMLVSQARAAASLFLGEPLPEDSSILRTVQNEMMNIALIGMPGCGKSTTAQALAQLTGREAVDLDDCLALHTGMSASDYLIAKGEASFRIQETKVLASAGKSSGKILATGGGVVTQAGNYALLHQNSIIVYLKRDPDALELTGRPLSQRKGLARLAKERLPLYESWADYTVQADSALQAAKMIQEMLQL